LRNRKKKEKEVREAAPPDIAHKHVHGA